MHDLFFDVFFLNLFDYNGHMAKIIFLFFFFFFFFYFLFSIFHIPTVENKVIQTEVFDIDLNIYENVILKHLFTNFYL